MRQHNGLSSLHLCMPFFARIACSSQHNTVFCVCVCVPRFVIAVLLMAQQREYCWQPGIVAVQQTCAVTVCAVSFTQCVACRSDCGGSDCWNGLICLFGIALLRIVAVLLACAWLQSIGTSCPGLFYSSGFVI